MLLPWQVLGAVLLQVLPENLPFEANSYHSQLLSMEGTLVHVSRCNDATSVSVSTANTQIYSHISGI